ncbi:thymidylate kinase, partial [Athelia psychrophila]
MPQRGAFIVIEGLDRSGKTTQTTLLHDTLQATGVAVNLLKFPDRTTAIGQMIDAYLRSQSDLDDQAIHLLFSANRWELASKLSNLLESGVSIIADRYAFSGIAFSASKGLSFEWCRSPDIGLPAPDLTIFLDVEPEVARSRGGYGEERYEKEEMQRGVRGWFKHIGTEMASTAAGGKWVTLDAGLEVDAVQKAIWALVEPLAKGVDGPIAKLWEKHLSPQFK